MKRQRSFLTALTLSVFWAFGYGGASARDIVVHAGKLIDGASKTVQSNVSIFIHDDRISGIQPGFATPKGFTVVDLSKSTVLPGLIDCHDHITNQFDGGNPVAEAVTETDYDDAVKSTAYARTTLLAGFTSIRDVGAVTGVVVALKRAIAKGIVDGPRMWVAGTPLGPTDGHNDSANGFDPALSHPGWTDNIVNSPEDARRIVRTLRRASSGLLTMLSVQPGCDKAGSKPLALSLWPSVGPNGVPATHMRGPSTMPFAMARLSATTTPVTAPTSRILVKPASKVVRA